MRCRGRSGPDDQLPLGTVEWHMRGNGIHSSAGGLCTGMTSLDPYKSGNKGKKSPSMSSENALHTYLTMVLFKVKVTVNGMTPPPGFHPCKAKWTKSSQTLFKNQLKSPVLLVKRRKRALSVSMAQWLHAK